MVQARLLVVLAGAYAAPLTKVLFSEEVAASYGGRCLDGSPAGYYLREVPGSKDWVFYLQGGGLCIEPIDCIQRSKGNLGSSKKWGDIHTDTSNVLNDNPDENPFAGFNAVYMPYCSGDTYLGIKKDKNLLMGNLYAQGHLILEAALDHLYNTTSMGQGVGRVLLTGGSAGGIGAFHNADWLTDTITSKFGFSEAIVKASPQAGLFFPSQPDAGVCLYQEFELVGKHCPAIDILESWWVKTEEHAFIDPKCKKKITTLPAGVGLLEFLLGTSRHRSSSHRIGTIHSLWVTRCFAMNVLMMSRRLPRKRELTCLISETTQSLRFVTWRNILGIQYLCQTAINTLAIYA